jgi:diketogulonate reductase-like aldo/keto reductase
MIRWQIQRGVVAIPKSTKKERIKENIEVFDFSLTDEEMKTLKNMK